MTSENRLRVINVLEKWTRDGNWGLLTEDAIVILQHCPRPNHARKENDETELGKG